MKKFSFTILCLVVLGIGYCIGYFFGSNDVFISADNHVVYWNKDRTIYQLRSECIAYANLLHRFYGNMDNEPWYDAVMTTPEYWALDSVLHEGAGWEDFYAPEWEDYTPGYAPGDTLEIPVDYDYL